MRHAQDQMFATLAVTDIILILKEDAQNALIIARFVPLTMIALNAWMASCLIHSENALQDAMICALHAKAQLLIARLANQDNSSIPKTSFVKIVQAHARVVPVIQAA